MSMQQGTIICHILIGMNHFKWGKKEGRDAGEMLVLHTCPKAEPGSLESEPETVSVPSELVPATLDRISKMKQFDVVMMNVKVLPPRPGSRKSSFQFLSFFEMPGMK